MVVFGAGLLANENRQQSPRDEGANGIANAGGFHGGAIPP
jgi:hypothetical protein